MIEHETVGERLDQLEVARAQDMSLILARFDAVEADNEALAKKLDYRFTAIEQRLERLETMLRLLLTNTQKLLKHLENE
jgi:hypothetical protein